MAFYAYGFLMALVLVLGFIGLWLYFVKAMEFASKHKWETNEPRFALIPLLWFLFFIIYFSSIILINEKMQSAYNETHKNEFIVKK